MSIQHLLGVLLQAARCGVVAILVSTFALAQAGGPDFDAELAARRGAVGNEAQLSLHTRVSFGSLSFLNLQDGFSARYDVSAQVYESDDRGRRRDLVMSRVFTREVPPIENFSETLADTLFSYSQYLLGSVPPGNYVVSVRAEDANTRASTIRDVYVEVPDFDRSVSMSTILLLEEDEAGNRLVRPNVANVFNVRSRRFIVSYDIYAAEPLNIQASYDIFRIRRNGRRTELEEVPELSLEAVDARRLVRGTNRVTSIIPTSDLRVGHYAVVLSVMDEHGNVLAGAAKAFELRWMGLLRQVSNLDAAIAQLEPIAKRKELQEMNAAPTRDEKYELFNTFWSKRDPTPRTERNERMEEFYYRVWYADNRFGSENLSGWESDRGKVFLRFGEPDKTEAFPINARERFEVWTYEGINRRFIFIDRGGAGNFQLFRPIWDERNRIR